MTKDEILKTAYDCYNKQLMQLQITSLKTSEYEADTNVFIRTLKDVRQRLNFKLKSKGICSDLLVNQIARHTCSLGEMFENKNDDENFKYIEYYNSSEILDIIELVELGIKKGESFKHKPLKNMYKVHHNSRGGIGHSLTKNIKNYWFGDGDKLLPIRVGDFDKIYTEKGLNNLLQIMYKMHYKAVMSKKLTGQWIIYSIHKDIKHYLCLAIHDEGDNNIFENKIKRCYLEFPELESKN